MEGKVASDPEVSASPTQDNTSRQIANKEGQRLHIWVVVSGALRQSWQTRSRDYPRLARRSTAKIRSWIKSHENNTHFGFACAFLSLMGTDELCCVGCAPQI